MSASMWIRQHPSAPKAVAIVNFGPNRSTAQRRASCGGAAANSVLAAASCSSVRVRVPMTPSEVPAGLVPASSSSGQYLYHSTEVFGKGRRRNKSREAEKRSAEPLAARQGEDSGVG